MQLPEGALPLSVSGYFYVRSPTGYVMYHQTPEGSMAMVVCSFKVPPQPSRWNISRESDLRWRLDIASPAPYVETADGQMVASHQGAQMPVGPQAARMFAEVLYFAAKDCEQKNKELEPLIQKAREAKAATDAEADEWREKRRKEREEAAARAKAEREQDEEECKKQYELLKWMVGDRIRLTRQGYRSTVFGKIEGISEPRAEYGTEEPLKYQFLNMHIITERDQWMSINLREVNTIDVKYDGDKRYTNIYKRNRERSAVA